MVEQLKDNSIKLKRVFVEAKLPEDLAPLRAMATNLWWSWDDEASTLFESLEPEKWLTLNYNPIAVLDQLSLERAGELMADEQFMQRLNAVYTRFQNYMETPVKPDSPSIIYFSMEYGLHISVRLYSGGLGILAGDYLKEASDQNTQLTAVGLLYRYGYFTQRISLHGDQISDLPPQEYTKLPMEPVRDEQGEWVKIAVDLPGRKVWAKIWRFNVGRISLYLLDADINENSWEDRTLTHQLYGGDNEHRLKQEMLLGIGGIRAMQALGIEADIYHCNEGHAAFNGVERLRQAILSQKLTYQQAREVIRSSSLFTTHTPVPAGHDYFPEHLLSSYLHDYLIDAGISWEQFLALGRVEAQNREELFSMSHLAIRLSQEVNGVSRLHGDVSRRMFNVLYPGFNHQEIPLGYVTNGVHFPSWIAREWRAVLMENQDALDFIAHQSEPEYWQSVAELDPARVARIRQTLKERLLAYAKNKLREDLTRRGEKPSIIFEKIKGVNPNAMVIGFARRFATYKRAHLLFKNRARLSALINNPDRPVMFIFAGKAHPADQPGQELIRSIVETSKLPEFTGKILFLEDYNMEMGKLLTQGVDIWMNTPTRPKEASGTSGMKAAMNGVVNVSVLDGWWAEGYRPDAGWSLPLHRTYEDQQLQDELDAETLYNLLEEEIIPSYFDAEGDGPSERWISYVKSSMIKVAPRFTMKRMLDDYEEQFYQPQSTRSRLMREESYELARQLSDWKAEMRQRWQEIEVMDRFVYDTENFSLKLGEDLQVRIKLKRANIEAEHLKLEAVFFKRHSDEELELKAVEEVPQVSAEADSVTFGTRIPMENAGVYEYGFRLVPQHPALPYTQDLELVRWL